MLDNIPKIVVITPIKNEEWILEKFLSVTSQFADLIIIADQNSTDGSRDICQKYPKVQLIENKSEQYDEASRQILLIQTARELVPEHKIILALDADEILAANAIHTVGWQTMLQAPKGTVLCFEKPDLYLTPEQCIRYDICWPLGYVDDGIEHNPKKVHSIRIPVPSNAPKLQIHDVKVLHYALLRILAQRSKFRLYSVVENILKTKSLFTRRRSYSSNLDWSKQAIVKYTPHEWFEGWENIGIDMKSIIDSKYYWWDFEILSYFKKYGIEKFWLDDIWGFDWEGCRLYAKSMGYSSVPDFSIHSPPIVFKLCIQIMDLIINILRLLKISIYRTK